MKRSPVPVLQESTEAMDTASALWYHTRDLTHFRRPSDQYRIAIKLTLSENLLAVNVYRAQIVSIRKLRQYERRALYHHRTVAVVIDFWCKD